MRSPSLLIIGCGYVGRQVAARWREQGGSVAALTRDPRRAEAFKAAGWQAIIGDITRPESLAALPAASTVLFAVGHDRRAGATLHEVYVDGLRNVLTALQRLQSERPASDTLKRFLYLSSTGVYGQSDGSWVDEQSPCEPVREGGRACLAAEQLLEQHAATADRQIVLRLAGIYGPGRIPRLRTLQRGEPIDAPEKGWLNLIHRDDAVSAVLAAAEQPPPRRYCVADGRPAPRRQYYCELARLIGAPPPQFAPPPADSAAAARALADKRVSNRRMLDELPVRLKYPSYREGLADIVAQDKIRHDDLPS